MQHENQNVKGEITVRRRLKELLQSPPSFLWKSSLSTQQLIRVDSDPVVSSTDHVRQWNMHIPTHPDIPRRTVMSEPSSWGSSSEWEDTEGWCCGSGTRNRNYPSPDSHQSGGGSKGSFTIFDNEASMIFEPCQRWQLTEFRCLYSASWCVWALQLSATNATRTKRYQKVNFQGRNQI